MYKKIISIASLTIIIAIGFTQKAALLEIIKGGGSLAMLVSALLVAICVFFPIIPFPILAGTIGALFGTVQGLLVTIAGAMAGTMGFFFLSRYGFREAAQSRLQKYPKIRDYEVFLNKHAFAAIFISRIIPIIPAPVVNIACGLSRVKWLYFFAASAIGKIPNILLLSYAGASFSTNKWFSFGLYGAYMLILGIIYFVVIYRKISKNT
ncbi:TVP38/TMEM64 family protein [Bacillota bacterium Lsc_1132]